MWIERDIQDLLVRRAQQRPVVVLTGARQTGKTSLVKTLFPHHELVSLDLPSEAELAERDPRAFFARHPPPLVVDEIQYAPGLFRHVKAEVDAHRDQNGQFILTGSQKFPLMKSVSESLAGRADILELEPLSWREARRARPALGVEEFLLRGGFPELHAHPEIEADGYYRAYVATYLERDLRQALNVVQLRDYERFLRVCALRTGQLLNRADLRARCRHQRFDGRRLAIRAASHRRNRPAGAVVFESHEIVGEDAQALLCRQRIVRIPLRDSFGGGSHRLAAGRGLVGNNGLGRAAAGPNQPERRVDASFLARPHQGSGFPVSSRRPLRSGRCQVGGTSGIEGCGSPPSRGEGAVGKPDWPMCRDLPRLPWLSIVEDGQGPSAPRDPRGMGVKGDVPLSTAAPEGRCYGQRGWTAKKFFMPAGFVRVK